MSRGRNHFLEILSAEQRPRDSGVVSLRISSPAMRPQKLGVIRVTPFSEFPPRRGVLNLERAPAEGQLPPQSRTSAGPWIMPTEVGELRRAYDVIQSRLGIRARTDRIGRDPRPDDPTKQPLSGKALVQDPSA
jgi:hypothetical protein